MKALLRPPMEHQAVYLTCVGQTQHIGDRQILTDMTARVVAAGLAYELAAELENLDAVVTIDMSQRERSLVGELYDRRLVAQTGSGRAIYDEIRSAASICPYCNFGEVYELDHFLPKSAFGELNVLPINLVPICHPCNHIKRETLPQGADR